MDDSPRIPQVLLEDGVREVFRTEEPSEHFFGYYDKSPFDASGTRMLSHRVAFASNRMPTAEDRAAIVVWDVATGNCREVASTRAFNWQQGAMLQWLGPDFTSRILFNDHRDGAYVSVILDLASGRERVLPRPVYSVTPDGQWAVCVNYDRLFWCRPGYNYACGGDPRFNVPIPKDDGITLLNLESGVHRLIVSTAEMTQRRALSSMQTGDNYLEHLLFAPHGERFFFHHRWTTPDGGLYSRPYTARWDGADIRLLTDSGGISHYAWRDDRTVMLYGSRRGYLNVLRRSRLLVNLVLRPLRPLFKLMVRPGTVLERSMLQGQYLFIDAFSGVVTPVGQGELRDDGHPSFHPTQPDLFVSDTYQDATRYRRLYLYHSDLRRKVPLGRFFSPAPFNDSAMRADLHPRWDREGKRVCVDSLHSGRRQMYVYDVSKAVERLLHGQSQTDGQARDGEGK